MNNPQANVTLRRSKLVNLLMLLCFLPLGTFGNNFHTLVHGSHCSHQHSSGQADCSDHSIASHLLTWFDSANQLLDDSFLALERQFDDRSDAQEIEDAVQPSYLVLDVLDESSDPSLPISSAFDVPTDLLVTQATSVSAPIRAGPQVSPSSQECHGDCHLSLVVRQVAVDSIAIEIATLQAVATPFAGFECPLIATCVASTLGSRGPPVLA